MTSLYLRRKAAERRFRFYGQCAIGFSLLILVLLLGSLITRGWNGLQEATLTIQVNPAPGVVPDADSGLEVYQALMYSALRDSVPRIAPQKQRELYGLVSLTAHSDFKRQFDHLMTLRQKPSGPMPVTLPVSDSVTLYLKGKLEGDALRQHLTETQQEVIEHWRKNNKLAMGWDWDFFSSGDSREPEAAGFLAAILGSFFTVLVALALAFPLAVATAVYLEEFAPKHWLSDVIEVNINNLAAVPSIVFGLLGLALYLNVMGLPRSSALVGGLTLALLVLPVIIIATRASLRAVPPSIRDAARALGASELQVVAHHVLPLAFPGILTGTILGIARIVGETAPLLMIGMVAFIADVPDSIVAPATAMPVQIYLWASSPETSFVEKTAAGILVLLVMLLIMNLGAVWLRKKYETRW